jgi:hypothetical protein
MTTVITMAKADLVRHLIQSLWNEPTKDLEVVCGNAKTGDKQTLLCHRPVLALASPFLKNLLQDRKLDLTLRYIKKQLKTTNSIHVYIMILIKPINLDNEECRGIFL